jgi:hypothetical protein
MVKKFEFIGYEKSPARPFFDRAGGAQKKPGFTGAGAPLDPYL